MRESSLSSFEKARLESEQKSRAREQAFLDLFQRNPELQAIIKSSKSGWEMDDTVNSLIEEKGRSTPEGKRLFSAYLTLRRELGGGDLDNTLQQAQTLIAQQEQLAAPRKEAEAEPQFEKEKEPVQEKERLSEEEMKPRWEEDPQAETRRLIELYNTLLDNRDNLERFNRTYKPEQYGVVNAMKRRQDRKNPPPPEFGEMAVGGYYLISIKENELALVVPFHDAVIRYDKYKDGGLEEFFDCDPPVGPRQIYRKVVLEKPAVFEYDPEEKKWQLQKGGKGKLRLLEPEELPRR